MTNEYNYVDHAEPSEIDELFKDFQKKCIDTLYNNVESEIDAIIKQNAQLTKENEKLRKQNKSLENIAIERTKSLNNSSTVVLPIEGFWLIIFHTLSSNIAEFILDKFINGSFF